MKVNNFELLYPKLVFKSTDDFYFLQIIMRKKENPDITPGTKIVKSYYIFSIDYLKKKEGEIMELCDKNNARAYLNLNVRSFEKVALLNLKRVTDLIISKNYSAMKSTYDSVCGEASASYDKKWLIDIDYDDVKGGLMAYELDGIAEFVLELIRQTGKDIVMDFVPTKNGVHIICRPFNLKKFRDRYPNITVHKNSPTLLYA